MDQLLALEAGHDRSLLHVMLLDDLKADDTSTLKALFEFLDVDPEPAYAIPVQRRNRYRISEPVEGVSGPVDYPPMNVETRARLVDTFQDSNGRLAQWLGRDLSALEQGLSLFSPPGEPSDRPARSTGPRAACHRTCRTTR